MSKSMMRQAQRGSITRSACLVVLVGFLAQRAGAANFYHWNGTVSSDWATQENWGANNMAPTGGTADATLYITNRTNNPLVYSEANGTTIYTSTASPSRCLRIADNANGSLIITGGHLETRSSSGDFVGNSTGVGQVLIDGGTFVSTNGVFSIGANNGLGSLTVNSGWARLGTINCWSAAGSVTLNGGLLTVGSVVWQTGSTAFKLNSGTLQAGKNVTSSWFDAKTNISCNVAGNILFDSQDYSVTNTLPLFGTGTVSKVGAGVLALNVSNTLNAVTVYDGTLALGGSNTLSAGAVIYSGTLAVNHAFALGETPLSIYGGRLDGSSGGQTVTNAQSGPVNVYSNFTFAGTKDLSLGLSPVTLFRNTVVTNLSKTLTWSGPVGDGGGNYALAVAGSGALRIDGNLAIGGKVTVTGGGTLMLAAANSYTGTTTVSSGTLIVANNDALGTTNGISEVSGPNSIQLLNGITIAEETLNLGGQGPDNKGALQAASGTSAWNGTIKLNENNTAGWTPRLGYKNASVLVVNGPVKNGVGTHLWISGDQGDGRVILASATNTYTGITGIIRGTLALGTNNALPTVTKLDMHPASAALEYSRFDLNGFNQTIAALYQTASSSPRIVTNSSETASVLTVNQSTSALYSGLISGNMGLVKDGVGTLTLAGTNNTYTGATVLNGGVLALGADGALSAASAVTLAGGTLSAGTFTNAVQQLTVSGSVTIDLGDGAGSLSFADSSAQSWSGLLDLTGTVAPGSVRFGTSASGLTPEQLDLIRVNGQIRWLALDADGYLYERKGTFFFIQ